MLKSEDNMANQSILNKLDLQAIIIKYAIYICALYNVIYSACLRRNIYMNACIIIFREHATTQIKSAADLGGGGAWGGISKRP